MIDRDIEDTSSARDRTRKKPPVLKGIAIRNRCQHSSTLSVCHAPLDKLASP